MIARLANGNVAVVGKWVTRDEQIEIDKLMTRPLTVDETAVVLTEEAFQKAMTMDLIDLMATTKAKDSENKFPCTP